MGLGQSTAAGVCALPADYTLSEGKKPLSAPELQRYIQGVRQNVTDHVESFPARYGRYLQSFEPDVDVLKRCVAELVDELQLGLELHRDAMGPNLGTDRKTNSLKMLDAFVAKTPSGHESGVFYALDFGGSNFRILRCSMAAGKIDVKAKRSSLMDCHCDLPKGLMDPKATATLMFDFFAGICKDFMLENGDLRSDGSYDKIYSVGFTFSYSCCFRSVKSSDLVQWTKGFETGRQTDDPVEGNDVGLLMNLAFKRAKLPLDVVCVANDTVGTMLSCAYTIGPDSPTCCIGAILGTGLNLAYVEEKATQYGYVGNVINTECGNFNRSLPRTNIDYELDFADSGGRGRQHSEKMIAGAYLGEIVRRTCVKVFQYKASPAMWIAGSFGSSDASVCISDKSPNLVVVDKKVREQWNTEFTLDELQWVQNLCEVVFRRSAAFSAMLIAGISLKTGRLQEAMGGLTVGLDGSLWKCNPKYRKDVAHYLERILGKSQASLIQLVNSEDGSGLGAAILAAVVDSSSTSD